MEEMNIPLPHEDFKDGLGVKWYIVKLESHKFGIM